MNRRSFLSASGSTMLVAHSPMLFATDGMSENPLIMGDEFSINSSLSQSKVTIDPGLSRRQWKTIIAVQNHLFPSEQDAPGAKEVNSQAYLYAVLSDANRDDEDRQLVKNGLLELQDICWKQYKKLFTQLTAEQAELVLRELEKLPDGRPWLMTILGYIFEALLVDPVYGGNPNGIGWKWLEHQAGLPRPTMETRYFLL